MSDTSAEINAFDIILDRGCFEDPWMKPSDREIVQPVGNVYRLGSQLRGILRIAVTKPLKCNGLYISAQGHMYAAWNKDPDEPDRLPSSGTIMNNCSYCDVTMDKSYTVLPRKQLYACDETQCLPVGDHHFPFALNIPANIPPSFHGKFGVIFYWIDAYLDRQPDDVNIKATENITLHGDWDMSGDVTALMSYQAKEESTYCCMCCQGGTFGFVLDLPRKGFTRGEEIAPSIQLQNHTDSECVATVKLTRRTVYICETQELLTEKKILATHEWRQNLQSQSIWIPRTEIESGWPPSKLNGCDEISFQYELLLKVQPDGCNCDSVNTSVQLFIGGLPPGFQTVPVSFPELHLQGSAQTVIHAPVDLTGAMTPLEASIHAPVDLTRGTTSEKQTLLPRGDVNASCGYVDIGSNRSAPGYTRPSAPTMNQPQAAVPIPFEDYRPPPPSYTDCMQLSMLSGAGPEAQYGTPQGTSSGTVSQPHTGYQHTETQEEEKKKL